jgi:hypothetical protein
MTPRDDSIDPDLGLDELEEYRSAGPPEMTPPVDRKTPREPDPSISASQVVEIVSTMLAPMKAQLKDIHEMVMGVKLPDGTVFGGISRQTHDINNSALIVADAANVISDAFVDQVVARGEKRKSLPELIAQSVANKFIEIHQNEMRPMVALFEDLLIRVAKLEDERHVGTNGNKPPVGP